MISDADIATLCCGIYDYPGAEPVAWDHLDTGEKDDGVCWGVVKHSEADVIVLRGSTTLWDWVRDFSFVGDPLAHRDLGQVHYGFTFGVPEMWDEAKQIVGKNVIVAGHSLGAARADVLTALMVLDGNPPMATVVFGEPMPGYKSFCDIISPYPRRSYCNRDSNGHDSVTDVPFADFLFPYTRPSPLIYVSASPDQNLRERWKCFAMHHMTLYVKALRS